MDGSSRTKVEDGLYAILDDLLHRANTQMIQRRSKANLKNYASVMEYGLIFWRHHFGTKGFKNGILPVHQCPASRGSIDLSELFHMESANSKRCGFICTAWRIGIFCWTRKAEYCIIPGALRMVFQNMKRTGLPRNWTWRSCLALSSPDPVHRLSVNPLDSDSYQRPLSVDKNYVYSAPGSNFTYYFLQMVADFGKD